MPVTIQNRSWQMQVFNLVHDAYCRGRACSCSEITTVVVNENPRTGERAPRRVPKCVPAALTLLAREVRTGLPNTVLQVPDIQAALARGTLRVVAQTPESTPAPAPAAKGPAEVRQAPAPETPRPASATPAASRGARAHEGARGRSAATERKDV
ncbi:MAG: hypothetical protein JXB32_07590 [Deltaproteobacteria bacterium]|nr:hypothetical protein [Deltaproteobacteria bacterium]